jgi:hypothetical protein
MSVCFKVDRRTNINSLLYLSDKRDDLNIPIVSVPFISSNIPSVPTFTFVTHTLF